MINLEEVIIKNTIDSRILRLFTFHYSQFNKSRLTKIL